MAANLEVVSLSFLSQQGDHMDFVVLCNIFQGSYEKKIVGGTKYINKGVS